MRDMISRFWSKVNKGPGCWEWTACTNGVGYGRIRIKGKQCGAHRVSYEIEYGPIPNSLYVCHHCDNKLCVRPNHLFLGTQKDNLQDAVRKGKTAKGEKHSNSKLTEQDVRKIRVDTRLQKEIAKEYKVDRVTISDIKRREAWKHV